MLARNLHLSFFDDLNARSSGRWFSLLGLGAHGRLSAMKKHVPGFVVLPVFPLLGNVGQL